MTLQKMAFGELASAFRLYSQDDALPADLRQRTLRAAAEANRYLDGLLQQKAVEWLVTNGRSATIKPMSITYLLHRMTEGCTPEVTQMQIVDLILDESDNFLRRMKSLCHEASTTQQLMAAVVEMGNAATAPHHEESADAI